MCLYVLSSEDFRECGTKSESAIDMLSTSGGKRKQSRKTRGARRQPKKASTSINRIHVRERQRVDLSKRHTDQFKFKGSADTSKLSGEPHKPLEMFLIRRRSKHLCIFVRHMHVPNKLKRYENIHGITSCNRIQHPATLKNVLVS